MEQSGGYAGLQHLDAEYHTRRPLSPLAATAAATTAATTPAAAAADAMPSC